MKLSQWPFPAHAGLTRAMTVPLRNHFPVPRSRGVNPNVARPTPEPPGRSPLTRG